jgi:hypothetical protein
LIRLGGLEDVAVVLHLRPACDHVAGDLEARHVINVTAKGRPTLGRLDERELRLREGGGVERIKAGD